MRLTPAADKEPNAGDGVCSEAVHLRRQTGDSIRALVEAKGKQVDEMVIAVLDGRGTRGSSRRRARSCRSTVTSRAA